MTSELTALARQGDPSAIAALMNRTLKPKGITAKAVARQGCLQIQLESTQVPNQTALTKFVSQGLNNLGVRSIRSVRLYGYQVGSEIPAWEEELVLPNAAEEPTILEIEEETSQNGAMPATMTSSSFDSDWQDESAPPPRRRSNSRLLLPLLAIALLAGLGALAYYLLPRLSPQPEPLPTLADSPVATEPTPEPTATVAPSQTPFRDAVNRATEAATQTQTAATADEWQQVVTLWEEAIVLMNQVPQNDANYATAQEKVSEYQGYLDYAQRKLDEAS
ncbi:hypothetical protein H6F67_17215 [Microcoleus sp. FACHB-1515]|uniref:hypothetical protein n=1 Tax=Cyanophyceae TaxID=3028117 RepID=UPI001687451F|nr:hypothetical protein [Microcoleus sp. FACHB-1515]MBD2091586.1 hypothetical protein [Microcoleus sp. FACHB-1515]